MSVLKARIAPSGASGTERDDEQKRVLPKLEITDDKYLHKMRYKTPKMKRSPLYET
jgi:hypothetical protein